MAEKVLGTFDVAESKRTGKAVRFDIPRNGKGLFGSVYSEKDSTPANARVVIEAKLVWDEE